MKKRIAKLFIVFVLTFFFWKCKTDKILVESEFEQAVFYEVFPLILDSVYSDIRLIPPPPPPPEFLAEGGYVHEGDSGSYNLAYERYKNSGEYKTQMEGFAVKKDFIERDTSFVYLVIQDTVSIFNEVEVFELKKHFKDKNIKINSNDISKKFRIDVSKLTTHRKNIRFMYQSKFPKSEKFMEAEYDYLIVAALGFSNIRFDELKNYGILNASYVLGSLNGIGVRVFLKKDKNGHWIIDKIVNTWIS